MKLHWTVLFFLLGLLGGCAPQSSQTQAPSPASSSASKSLVVPLPAKVSSVEEAITEALNQIPKGDVYHNVPQEMQVGVSETIEAGIAPRVTEQIKKKLQGKGEISVESGIRFDPAGMEMKLVAQPDEFTVFEVKGGEQVVIAEMPGKWIWRITPLKSGDKSIVIKATVKFEVPKVGTRSIEVEVFSTTRKVKVNLAYSIRQFVTTNWKEILPLVVGSGSLASFITWLISKKNGKNVETKEG